MSWQNQAGQQYPGLSSFPGQAGQPMPGYPGMPQFQTQTPIPPEVIATAQGVGLGIPTREYHRGTVGNNPVTSSINRANRSVSRSTNFSMILTAGIMLVVALIIFFQVPAPENLYTAGLLVLITLITVGFMLGMRRFSSNMITGMSSRITTGMGMNAGEPLVAWSCPDGLVYKIGGQLSAVRWENIRQIWRKVGMLNGTLTTMAYIVQPDNAPQFAFSPLSGPFANMALLPKDPPA